MRILRKITRQLRSAPGSNDNFRYYTTSGVLFTIVTIFTRTYAPKFMDRLGADSLHFSLFNALPGLVAVLTTIPGILYIQNSKDKEKLMRRFFYLSRFFPLLFILTPFLPQGIRAYVFVLLFSLMNLPESIGQTALQSWTGDIFKPGEVADALSIRNRLSQVTMLAVSVVVGLTLSLPDSGSSHQIILIYQVLFGASVLFGIFEIRSLKRITPVRINPNPRKLQAGRSMVNVFRHKPFRSFILCSLLFHFGWQMGWPLFSYYQISILGADEKWLTVITAVSAISMALSYRLWSAFIKRNGMKLTTAVVCLGMATSPVLAAWSPTLPIYVLINVTMGFFTSGITVVILGSLLESTKPEDALVSTAVHQTLINLTLFLSPFLGEIFLRSFGIDAALYASAAFRTVGALAFFTRWYVMDVRSGKSSAEAVSERFSTSPAAQIGIRKPAG